MKPSDDIVNLATEVANRRNDDNANPFALLLGAHCAEEAHVPPLVDVARQILSDSPDVDSEVRVPQTDDATLVAFYSYLDSIPRAQRYRKLQRYYISVPVPSFYQDLALLVKAGYFPRILTTNFDTLLEQALSMAGLVQGSQYIVMSMGGSSDFPPEPYAPAPPTGESGSSTRQTTIIIKLHGDLAQQSIAITPDQISRALMPQRTLVKGNLDHDIVLVGYKSESPPVNEWLAHGKGELWWVGDEYPSTPEFARVKAERNVHVISGPDARPEEFFSKLYYLLQRQPIVRTLKSAPVAPPSGLENSNPPIAPPSSLEGMRSGGVSFGVGAQIAPDVEGAERSAPSSSTVSAQDYDEQEYLQGQVRLGKALLSSLEQSAPPGAVDSAIQAQIDYQRRQIGNLEDQLRSLSNNKERVQSLIHVIVQAAKSKSSLDKTEMSTLGYLQRQVDAIDEEYGQTSPNQYIIGAAISAAVVAADRLGPGVVDASLVRQLSAFAPSTAIRG